MTIQVKITPTGRMSLPAGLRKRLGLANGGDVFIEETADGLVIRTANQAVMRAQALARRYTDGNPDAGADGFIARRRDQSGA